MRIEGSLRDSKNISCYTLVFENIRGGCQLKREKISEK